MTKSRALAEANLGPAGDFPACFAFSIHKAGSSLMNAMIEGVCRKASVPFADLPNVFFREGIFDAEWREDGELLDLFQDGRVYSGFRYLPQLFEGSDFVQRRKSVLLVRDPRDALVSQYFSFAGPNPSHGMPAKNQEKVAAVRRRNTDIDIDTYVLKMADVHLEKLRYYRDRLDFDNVLLRRYEQAYYDKKSFLADVFAHFGIAVDAGIVSEVAAAHDIRPTEEQTGKHIRKGTPGDHREKLKPQTVEQLNEKFAPIGTWYGYTLS